MKIEQESNPQEKHKLALAVAKSGCFGKTLSHYLKWKPAGTSSAWERYFELFDEAIRAT